MSRITGPLLTLSTASALRAARDAGLSSWTGSLDLGRSQSVVELGPDAWSIESQRFPYPDSLKDRALYHFDGNEFAVVARYSGSLIKLVPTEWGPPTFEIDGIKMLPTAQVSPYDDARRKVELIAPRGKRVLDTCGGLGYFASWCLQHGANRVLSFEKNADVLWLRRLNPWSPDPDEAAIADRFDLRHADISLAIAELADASVDAILHDPPRFGIAGELYSQRFYDQLARVIESGGRLFHYTGSPNKLTSGRDVPNEVSKRLQKAGFRTELALDGVLAIKAAPAQRRR